MPHFYPIVIQSGKSLSGDSLGFHAYSLRIDNLTNQWLIEETSMAWIPPYSLGVCLRLYGTGVAIILNQAPAGQPQPSALAGEQTIGVYSDQLRTEVGGTAVRQFTLVQAVSDLTEGPQPAFPPVGVDRLYADPAGNIHHLHSTGVDLTLVDPSNATVLLLPVLLLGGDLSGQLNAALIVAGAVTAAKMAAGAAAGNVGALGGVLTGTLPNPGLANGAVDSAKLAANSVASANIIDGTIVNGDLAAGTAVANVGALGGALTGTLPNPGLGVGAAAANVGAVGGVLTGTLPNPGMAAGAAVANVGAVGGVLTGTLPNPGLANGAVSLAAQLAAGVIDHTKIANGEVWNQNLAGASVDNSKLAANAVASNNIIDATIVSADIAAATITRANLAASATVRRIANYLNILSWGSAGGAGWLETTLNVVGTLTDTGQIAEVFVTCSVYTSIVGFFYAAIGVDSSVGGVPYFRIDTPVANVRVLVNLHLVWPGLTAGAHRFGLFLQQGPALTVTIDNSAYSTIDVVEWNN